MRGDSAQAIFPWRTSCTTLQEDTGGFAPVTQTLFGGRRRLATSGSRHRCVFGLMARALGSPQGIHPARKSPPHLRYVPVTFLPLTGCRRHRSLDSLHSIRTAAPIRFDCRCHCHLLIPSGRRQGVGKGGFRACAGRHPLGLCTSKPDASGPT